MAGKQKLPGLVGSAAATTGSSIARKPFRAPRGEKPVWLPEFTITLLRSPFLPPNFASFLVPLSMNKLDLKDYLWQAYGVPVLAVRSFIQQQPVQRLRQGRLGRGVMRRWYRPRSTKKMTVEMGAPEEGREGKGGGLFVWPDELKSDDELEPWDKRTFDEANKAQEEYQQQETGIFKGRFPQPGRDTLAEQAKRLREGKEEWAPTWRDLQRE